MANTKKYYGLGMVVSDKVEDSYDIEVYPIENIPTASGELSVSDSGSATVKDNAGNSVSVAYEKGNIIPCTWYPNGEQNRISAPDVCKGDLVEIYTFGDTDKYYWSVFSHNADLRKREKVMYVFSNKGSVGSIADKSYFLLVDTINKKTHYHTSDNDGEAVAFDFLFDGTVGVTLTDSLGNSIVLESINGKLNITTTADIVLNTKNVEVNCTSSVINASASCDIKTSTMTISSDVTYIN